MNPYLIKEPTVINFSGGRTSGYMLYKILEANNGLPDEAKVIFANTGKEDLKTLDFIEKVSKEWKVEITWLEYISEKPNFKVVNYETASRNGEPFAELIRKRKYLPNTIARFCTIDMKILTAKKYLESIGWDEWISFVGIRADEQRRVAKIRANPFDEKTGITRDMPLAKDNKTVHDVKKFWDENNFDLELVSVGGHTLAGNCDLCFLKPAKQVLNLIKEKPERAIWWIEQEKYAQTLVKDKTSKGIRFAFDRPSYTEMGDFMNRQFNLFDEQEKIECFCGD